MKRIFIIAAVFMLPIISLAAEVTSAKITDFGIYSRNTIDTEKLAGAPTGNRANIDGIVFSEKTTRIPAKKDVRFGFRFVLDGTPSGSDIVIKRKVIHPPITEDKQVFTAHEYELTYTLGTETVTGYAFGSAYLMVPGEWTFQIFFEGKKLLEQTFTVYKP